MSCLGTRGVSDKARDMTRNKGILVESCVILTWNTSLLVALIVIYLLFSFFFSGCRSETRCECIW